MEPNQNEPATTPAPYAAGTGTAVMLPGREALDRMSYRERLALKREDPAGYAALRHAPGNDR